MHRTFDCDDLEHLVVACILKGPAPYYNVNLKLKVMMFSHVKSAKNQTRSGGQAEDQVQAIL